MLNLKNTPIIYVTRDIERALGLSLNTKGYFIISNFSDFAKAYAKHKNVLLIKEKKALDTWELLQNPEVKQFINQQKNSNLLVFKNTLQIEKTCAENNWSLLNPRALISNQVEEKISQITWLGPLKKYLPKYSVLKCKEIYSRKFRQEKNNPLQFFKPFILQFNRSHTGSGTILIENEKQLKELQNKFPDREVRIAEYIPGPLFTNNNVVTNSSILIGNINYQITGLKPFTDLPFSTIGNDWTLPHKILTKKQITEYKKIATEVGMRLKKAGWRGLFGIDVVLHEYTGKLYLLEINCRQPASTTYESQLQDNIKTLKHKNILTTFEAHLMALLKQNLKNQKLIEIKDGSQIIQRNTKSKIKSQKLKVKKLKEKFDIIEYNNKELNTDLIRIQSNKTIMKNHNEFNEVGKKILGLIS